MLSSDSPVRVPVGPFIVGVITIVLLVFAIPLLFVVDSVRDDFHVQQRAEAEYHQSVKADLAEIKAEVKKLSDTVGRSRTGSGAGAVAR